MTESRLSAEEISDRILDPALIASHEEALEVQRALQVEISNIEVQLTEWEAAAESGTLPPGHSEIAGDLRGTDWHRRASYALSSRKETRRLINARDRELRGVAGPPVADPAVRIAWHMRMAAEADARKTAQMLHYLRVQERMAETAERGALARHFVEAAVDRLDGEVVDELMVEAKRRRMTERAHTKNSPEPV